MQSLSRMKKKALDKVRAQFVEQCMSYIRESAVGERVEGMPDTDLDSHTRTIDRCLTLLKVFVETLPVKGGYVRVMVYFFMNVIFFVVRVRIDIVGQGGYMYA